MCPRCGGGSSKERTLSLTKTTTHVLYNCYRAKCDLKGAFSLGTKLETPSPRHAKPIVKRSSSIDISALEFTDIPAEVLANINELFHVDEELVKKVGWKWEAKLKRLALPLRGLFCDMGYNLRSLDRGVSPKSLVVINNKGIDTQPYSIYRITSKNFHRLLIVEDQISAARMAPYMHCLAICGTNLSERLVSRLKKTGYTDIILALDNDAFTKALRIQKEYSALFETFPVRKLEKDIKNMDVLEFGKLVNDIS